jgi:hypothetical protein
MQKYVLRIHVAAPGTPLVAPDEPPGATSLPGHMYYSIVQGASTLSFGFAPITPGQISGPGKIYDNDVKNYMNPLYTRNLEITKEQYEKLQAFGERPAQYGFNLYYQDVRNNCVDFVWSALNHAGIHARSSFSGKALKTYEGSLKPTRNIDDIKSIQAPIPNSPHNREHRNPMPPRSVLQKLFSETNQPSNMRRYG